MDFPLSIQALLFDYANDPWQEDTGVDPGGPIIYEKRPGAAPPAALFVNSTTGERIPHQRVTLSQRSEIGDSGLFAVVFVEVGEDGVPYLMLSETYLRNAVPSYARKLLMRLRDKAKRDGVPAPRPYFLTFG